MKFANNSSNSNGRAIFLVAFERPCAFVSLHVGVITADTFVQLFDSRSKPATGDRPKRVWPITANNSFDHETTNGIPLQNGCVVALSSTAYTFTEDTNAPPILDVVVSIPAPPEPPKTDPTPETAPTKPAPVPQRPPPPTTPPGRPAPTSKPLRGAVAALLFACVALLPSANAASSITPGTGSTGQPTSTTLSNLSANPYKGYTNPIPNPNRSLLHNSNDVMQGSAELTYSNSTLRVGAFGTNPVTALIALGTNPPSGRLMEFPKQDPTNIGSFVFNLSTTANTSNVLGGNPVMQWGYNLNQGGNLIDSRDTAIGFGLEGNYDVGDARYVEAHLYFVKTNAGGTQTRPWSWRINKYNSNDWVNLIYASQIQVYNPSNPTTANYFLNIAPSEITYMPSAATNGIQFTGANGSHSISRAGSGTANLQIKDNWGNVQLPTTVFYTAGVVDMTAQLNVNSGGVRLYGSTIGVYNTGGTVKAGQWDGTTGDLLIGSTLGSYSNAAISVISTAMNATGTVRMAHGVVSNSLAFWPPSTSGPRMYAGFFNGTQSGGLPVAGTNFGFLSLSSDRWSLWREGLYGAETWNVMGNFNVGASLEVTNSIHAGGTIEAGVSMTTPLLRLDAGNVRLLPQSSGVVTLLDSGATSFGRLQLGGNTAAFPAIGRSTGHTAIFGADGTSDGTSTNGVWIMGGPIIQDFNHVAPAAPSRQGAVYWNDGTNVCVVLRNSAGALSTNRLSMTAW